MAKNLHHSPDSAQKKNRSTKMVNSKTTLKGFLKEMEAICFEVYFEILVEPKVQNKQSEGKRYIIKSQTNKDAEELIVTFNDQLNRINQLQDYYTDMLEKVKELFSTAKQEHSDADFKVSLLKRKRIVFPYLHYRLTEPQVIIRPLESRGQAREVRVNHAFFEAKSVCDDEFFDVIADTEQVEGKKENEDESMMFELKEMRAPYRGKSIRRNESGCQSEELYQTTQL